MSALDALKIVDGYFEDNRFIMRGLAGRAVFGTYTAAGLLSLANVISSRGEALRFTIDNDKHIELTAAQSKQFRSELLAIANELED
ncbi:hypothetical protein [Bacillus sp. UNC438CL73TsuS30]|uniref:hypothetical protein n=1 Tax=Bacillus sp. UNC438CL73TsuS30 TaxID=1340434 RepID=UPI00047BFA20|nr:hypothetical protein [Bacillus sp. UNC438CL73TsuS30]